MSQIIRSKNIGVKLNKRDNTEDLILINWGPK